MIGVGISGNHASKLKSRRGNNASQHPFVFWVGIRVPVQNISESIWINLAAVSDPVCNGMNCQKAEIKFRKTLY